MDLTRFAWRQSEFSSDCQESCNQSYHVDNRGTPVPRTEPLVPFLPPLCHDWADSTFGHRTVLLETDA